MKFMIQFIQKTVILITLSALLPGVTYAQKVEINYIKEYSPLAVRLMEETGIPASIILGISMIESAMGTSKNCRLLKNYFGVKGKNTLAAKGEKHRSQYKEYNSCEHSFKDFVRIVRSKKWYESLKGEIRYSIWLKKLNSSGYAEAQGKWIKDIESMIKKHNLARFDTLHLQSQSYFDLTPALSEEEGDSGR